MYTIWGFVKVRSKSTFIPNAINDVMFSTVQELILTFWNGCNILQAARGWSLSK